MLLQVTRSMKQVILDLVHKQRSNQRSQTQSRVFTLLQETANSESSDCEQHRVLTGPQRVELDTQN